AVTIAERRERGKRQRPVASLLDSEVEWRDISRDWQLGSAETMSQVPVWFERKFEFSFPVELYPNVCARLRGTPARLEETLRGRSHEILSRKTQGKWSAQEHAGHLLDLETLWLARLGDYVAGSEQLTVADLRNRKTDEADYNARPVEGI